jgi:pheromone shutdown protein TraB
MTRTLFYVPRMYTHGEFRALTGSLPEDFNQETRKFWKYVEEKLLLFAGRIQRIYRDGNFKSGKDALADLASVDSDNYSLAKKLADRGATFEATEDRIQIAESESWLAMLNSPDSDQMTFELYQQTIEERDNYVASRINETLKADETGVLFFNAGRRIEVIEDIKVITVSRFNPLDYLQSWQVKQRLRAGNG